VLLARSQGLGLRLAVELTLMLAVAQIQFVKLAALAAAGSAVASTAGTSATAGLGEDANGCITPWLACVAEPDASASTGSEVSLAGASVFIIGSRMVGRLVMITDLEFGDGALSPGCAISTIFLTLAGVVLSAMAIGA
jgi:hypothetical protein